MSRHNLVFTKVVKGEIFWTTVQDIRWTRKEDIQGVASVAKIDIWNVSINLSYFSIDSVGDIFISSSND